MFNTLLVAAVLLFASIFAADEVMIEPKEKDVFEEMRDIVDLMYRVEDHLRDDWHDELVQLKGKEIEERLEKLIKEIEANGDGDSNGKGDGKTKGDAPKRDSTLPRDTPIPVQQRDRMLWETREYDDWAKLDKVRRHGIIQSPRADLPMMWRKRIEAYFLSVNAEENEKLAKEMTAKIKGDRHWIRYYRERESNEMKAAATEAKRKQPTESQIQAPK